MWRVALKLLTSGISKSGWREGWLGSYVGTQQADWIHWGIITIMQRRNHYLLNREQDVFPCLQSLRLLFPLSWGCCPFLPTNSKKSLGTNLSHSIRVLSVLRSPPSSLFSDLHNVPLLPDHHLEVELGGSCLQGCRCSWKFEKKQRIKCRGIATLMCSDTFHSTQLAFAETQPWALRGDAQRKQGGPPGAGGPVALCREWLQG